MARHLSSMVARCLCDPGERMTLQAINPESLGGRPKGYSQAMLGRGRVLFISGQIGWDENEKLVSAEFVPQFERALRNIKLVLDDVGATPADLGRVTIYVTDKQQYIEGAREVGLHWRTILGKNYPAMTLVQVADLLEPGALVEIEATAVLDENTSGE